MAEAQEETVGQVAEVPQEKEASPVEKDVVKANGELPTSEQSAEIVGKGKEDPTLNSTAEGPAAAENGQSAIPSEEAKDIDGLSHPNEVSSPSEEVTESAKANNESPTGLDAEQGIEENFLSQVDSGKEDAVEAQTSPDVVEAEGGEAPRFGKTEKELPAEGIPAADEPQVAGPSEKTEEAEKTADKAEENPESVGHKEQVEEAPKPAEILETSEDNRAGQEETANPGETTQTVEPKTDVTGEGTPEVVDTTKADEAGTQVSEGEAPKSADAGETEAVVGGEEETSPKSEEATEEEVPKIEETNKIDKPSGAEFAEEEIPRTDEPNVPKVAAEEIPKSVETTETEEPNAPEVAGEETPKTLETTDTEEPSAPEVAAEEIPKSVETTETGEPSAPDVAAEETPKTLETTETDEPSVAEVAAEETPKTSESTETEEPSVPEVAAEETPKTLQSTETEEPSVPEVAAEESPKTSESIETEEPSVPEVAAEGNTKTLESTKTDDPSVTGVAPENIPETLESTETEEPSVPKVAAEEDPKALESTETEEPSVPEVAAEEIPKTGSLEPQVAEDETYNPSEIDEPKPADVVVDEKKEDPRDNTLTAAEDSAAAARESTSTVGEVGEPAKVGEGTPEEATASPSPVEQEPPAVEAEEPVKPKSFFGVVLKPVGSNGKSVDIQPKQEDSGQEPEANLHAAITEQETRGDAAPSALSEEKDVGPKEVEEAPRAEMESETVPEEVSPEASEDTTTETPESVEQGNVDDSSKGGGIPTSAVEEKEIPQPEASTESPASTPEDASTEPSSTAEEAPEVKETHKVEEPIETPITAAEDTIDRLTEETSKGAETEDTVAENPAGEDGSALEKQPDLSVSIPKQGEATAAEGETPEDGGLTTPRGTPLMQRVEQLEQKLAQLEGRQSPRSDFASTGNTTPRSSIDSRPIKHSTRYVLEETGSKGTLLERVAALEQKLAFINLHPPTNGQLTTPVATVSEDASTEPDSKSAESRTREWTPSGADGEEAPQTNFKEAFKTAEDPAKPNTEEKPPQDVAPVQTKPMAPVRNSSRTERKIKAKAAVGKLTGILAGCFAPKKTGT